MSTRNRQMQAQFTPRPNRIEVPFRLIPDRSRERSLVKSCSSLAAGSGNQIHAHEAGDWPPQLRPRALQVPSCPQQLVHDQRGFIYDSSLMRDCGFFWNSTNKMKERRNKGLVPGLVYTHNPKCAGSLRWLVSSLLYIALVLHLGRMQSERK